MNHGGGCGFNDIGGKVVMVMVFELSLIIVVMVVK